VRRRVFPVRVVLAIAARQEPRPPKSRCRLRLRWSQRNPQRCITKIRAVKSTVAKCSDGDDPPGSGNHRRQLDPPTVPPGLLIALVEPPETVFHRRRVHL
jgi:hypothetical protein